jgi:diguanylate cyclase (GGDEF)-like protein
MKSPSLSSHAHTVRLRVLGLALSGALLFFLSAGALDLLGRENAAEKANVAAQQKRAESVAAMAIEPGKPLDALAAAIASQADVLEVTFRATDGKTITQHIRQNRDETPRRIFKVPVRFSSGDAGTLELHLAEDGSVAGYAGIAWPFAVMAALFAGILFMALDRVLIGPLEKLVRHARELTIERELDAPIILRAEGYQELREVTDILNTVSRRVFDVKQRMEDKVHHANTALVATVEQLQSRSAELRERTQELETALETIGRLATTDSLTGIHNRRYFDERLRDALARAQRFDQPISMILFDIDKFKHINDTLGHAAGDAVLETLAHMIDIRTRASDVFVRMGGDEFAFILENTNLPEAQNLGENLLATVVAHSFTYETHTIPVTLSIGVAEFTHPPRNGETLYKASDDTLYEAKRNGRNQVVAYAFDVSGNRLLPGAET